MITGLLLSSVPHMAALVLTVPTACGFPGHQVHIPGTLTSQVSMGDRLHTLPSRGLLAETPPPPALLPPRLSCEVSVEASVTSHLLNSAGLQTSIMCLLSMSPPTRTVGLGPLEPQLLQPLSAQTLTTGNESQELIP
jgi:hypothetical protein